MSGFLGDVTELLKRGFGWWAGELASLWPGHASTSVARHNVDVTISAGTDGSLRVVDADRHGGRRDENRELNSENATFDYLSQLHKRRPKARIGIRLPYSACFERRVDIPAAARAQAPSIVALDLERSTPFKPADVYSSFTLAPAPARKGWLTAVQFVTKRKLADKAIADVEATGLTVVKMDCWSADGKTALPINFLEKDARAWLPGGNRKTVIALAAIATALLISMVWVSMSRREAALAELEKQVESARHKAEGVQQEQATTDAAIKSRLAVNTWKNIRPTTVEIINELTRLLPDDAYLNDLKIEGDTIDISGLAKSAAAIIPGLERSSMFKDALQTSAVAFDAAADKERFSLRLKIRPAAKTAVTDPVGTPAP